MVNETLSLATFASLSALWLLNCIMVFRIEDRINKRIEFLEKLLDDKSQKD